MKKFIKSLLFTIMIFTLVFTFIACDDKTEDKGGDKNVDANKVYFGIEKLDYNKAFSDEEDPHKFAIYDTLKLNKITFGDDLEIRDGYDVHFTLSKDDKVYYSCTQKTFFEPYIFTEVGTYTLDITAGTNVKIKETHKFEVLDNNLPVKIDYKLKVDDTEVESVTGGETAEITAVLYDINNNVITPDENSKFKAFWEGNDGTTSVLEMTHTFSNEVKDTTKDFDFHIQLHNNTIELTDVNLKAVVDVKNNLDTIEFDYGFTDDTSKNANGSYNIDVSKEKTKTSYTGTNTDYDGSLASAIKVNYVFTNGETQSVPFSSVGKDEHKAVMYVKFGDEQARLYNTDLFSQEGVSFYDSNRYNFEPDKVGDAQLYLTICNDLTFDIQDVYKETFIEGSELDIVVTKTDITSITVDSLSGKEALYKGNADWDKLNKYTDRHLNADGNIDLVVNTARPEGYDQEYMDINILVNADASCPDYTVTRTFENDLDKDGNPIDYDVLDEEEKEKTEKMSEAEKTVVDEYNEELNEKKDIARAARTALTIEDYTYNKTTDGVTTKARNTRIRGLNVGTFEIKITSLFGDVEDQTFLVKVTNPVIGYRMTYTSGIAGAHLFYNDVTTEDLVDFVIDRIGLTKIYHNVLINENHNYAPEVEEDDDEVEGEEKEEENDPYDDNIQDVPPVSGLRQYLNDNADVTFDENNILFKIAGKKSEYSLATDRVEKLVENNRQYKLGVTMTIDGFETGIDSDNGLNIFMATNYTVKLGGVETKISELSTFATNNSTLLASEIADSLTDIRQVLPNGVNVYNVKRLILATGTTVEVDETQEKVELHFDDNAYEITQELTFVNPAGVPIDMEITLLKIVFPIIEE